MANTSLYSVYRRTARAAAKQQVVKKTSDIDIEKARTDFAYFCKVVADKPPAEHMKLWHEHLHTHEDSECLIGIAGPNVDILAPRGSAKSTVGRIIREIIDPSKTDISKFPKQSNDFIQQITQHHLSVFDNVSYISEEQSDDLCRAATGGSLFKRKLYTDDDQVILKFKNLNI